MKTHSTLSVVFLILVCCSCSKSPETLVKGGYDEQEMDAAIARARSEVDTADSHASQFEVRLPQRRQVATKHATKTGRSLLLSLRLS